MKTIQDVVDWWGPNVFACPHEDCEFVLFACTSYPKHCPTCGRLLR